MEYFNRHAIGQYDAARELIQRISHTNFGYDRNLKSAPEIFVDKKDFVPFYYILSREAGVDVLRASDALANIAEWAFVASDSCVLLFNFFGGGDFDVFTFGHSSCSGVFYFYPTHHKYSLYVSEDGKNGVLRGEAYTSIDLIEEKNICRVDDVEDQAAQRVADQTMMRHMLSVSLELKEIESHFSRSELGSK